MAKSYKLYTRDMKETYRSSAIADLAPYDSFSFEGLCLLLDVFPCPGSWVVECQGRMIGADTFNHLRRNGLNEEGLFDQMNTIYKPAKPDYPEVRKPFYELGDQLGALYAAVPVELRPLVLKITDAHSELRERLNENYNWD